MSLILILGASQSLFLALLLATRRDNSAANRILAVAMVAFAVFILEDVSYETGYFRDFPHVIGLSKPLVFCFGPLMFLYVVTVSRGGHDVPRRLWLHFIPAAVVLAITLPFFVKSGGEKLAFLADLQQYGAPAYLAVIENLQYVHGIIYVVLTLVLLHRHRRSIEHFYSSTEQINLVWLRNLTVGIVVIWITASGLHVLQLAGFASGELEGQVTPVILSILVYAIGYFGLRQPEIFDRRRLPEPADPVPSSVEGAGPSALSRSRVDTPLPANPVAYEKSGLSPERATAIERDLLEQMRTTQPFKNNGLTLPQLAESMGISAHHLSEVINVTIGSSFYDFVNHYRVDEVKRRLADPESAHLTLLAIAEESGFNSKSSFNSFFKKATGQTPSQYRKEIQNAS